MNVLFQTRRDYLKNPAGDTVQILATAEGLRKLGIEVTVSTENKASLNEYDLIHIFNITRITDSYMFFNRAKNKNKKVVISPIYWNMTNFLHHHHNRSALDHWEAALPMRSRLVRDCDLLLPNGFSEYLELKRDFGQTAPYRVIPNGFPDFFTEVGPDEFRMRYPSLPQDFVLTVARISPRKNQDWLARICKDMGLPLVLIGPINDLNYSKKVRSYPNVTYLGVLEGRILASAYASAKIHALPSWFETPGLSSLEAGACGSVVLTTNQGNTQEYFKEMAAYIEPMNDDSLRKGLETANSLSPQPLMNHIRENYPWSKAAQLTLDAYTTILNHP